MITIVFSVLLLDNLFNKNYIAVFTRSDGIIMLLFFTVFVYYLIGIARKKIDTETEEYVPMLKAVAFVIVGLVSIILGSNLVVDNASILAKTIGVSEKMIALTIISLGTSLPELVTSIVATKKGEYDIAIGNIVGSNMFNLGIVIGIPVTLFGGITRITFNYIDLIVMIISVFLIYIFSLKNKKITKKQGLLLLLIFLFYYTYIIFNG